MSNEQFPPQGPIDALPDPQPQPEPSSEGPPAMGGPSRQGYDPFTDQPPPQGPGKMLLFVGLACLGLVCFGVVKSLFFTSPSEPRPRTQVRSMWSEQQDMMREALDMAREAQALQQQRMQQMERAMYESEFGYYEDEGQ